MNETTTPTLFEGAKDKELFANVLIHIIGVKYKEYVSNGDDVQLEHISFGIKHVEDRDRFENDIGIGNLQEIGKIQGNPRWKLRGEWKVTAQQMLDLFCCKCEIYGYHDGIYRLHTDGRIYKHLAEKLGITR